MKGTAFLVCKACGDKKKISIEEYMKEKKIYCCSSIFEKGGTGFFSEKYSIKNYYSLASMIEAKDVSHEEKLYAVLKEQANSIKSLNSIIEEQNLKINELLEITSMIKTFLKDQNQVKTLHLFQELNSILQKQFSDGQKITIIRISDISKWRDEKRHYFLFNYILYLEEFYNFKTHIFSADTLANGKAKDIAGVLSIQKENQTIVFEFDSRIIGSNYLNWIISFCKSHEIDWEIGEGANARNIKLPIVPLNYIFLCPTAVFDVIEDQFLGFTVIDV